GCHFQLLCPFGESVQRVHISIEFVVEAAFQPSALSRQFGLINRKVLITCSGSIYGAEIGEPGTATQLAATGSDATYFSTLLACAYLAHFHFCAKFCSKYFDQFPEVNPCVGGIEKAYFFAV